MRKGRQLPAFFVQADRAGRVGFRPGRTHNPPMEIKSDHPEHGFQFPGTFELSAMGTADKDLETVLPTRLLDAGIEVLHESVSWKHSSNGRYVSVRISFRAESREQYDQAHQVLRDHPEVKWTL
jgi:uncharacterized protein